MPTLTIAEAILQLTDMGVPWEFPVWQEGTGVYHGLNPVDPAQLPKGWTPEDAADINSFLSRYSALSSDSGKAHFLSNTANVLPGKKKWQTWINAVWRSSGFQNKIIEVFSARNCHPLTQSRVAPKEKIDNPTSLRERRIWPSGATWIPICLDDVAITLFGEDCLGELGYLPEAYRNPTQALAQRTWTGLTRRLENAQKRVFKLEIEAKKAFDGKYISYSLATCVKLTLSCIIALDEQHLTKAAVRAVIRATAKWRLCIEFIQTPNNIKTVEAMEAELDRLMQGLGAKPREKKKEKSPVPRKYSL